MSLYVRITMRFFTFCFLLLTVPSYIYCTFEPTLQGSVSVRDGQVEKWLPSTFVYMIPAYNPLIAAIIRE